MVRAIQDYTQAFQLLFSPGLRRYIILPGFVSLLVGVVFIILISLFGGNVGSWLVSFIPESWMNGTFLVLGKITGYVLLILIAFLVFRNILMIVLGPFLGPLSEKVEKMIAAETMEGPFSLSQTLHQNVRSLRLNLRILISEMFWTIFISILGLLPVIGWLISLSIFGVQSFYGGIGVLDFTLERHLNYRESLRFIKQFRFQIVGNGMIFILLLMIPVAGLFVAPALSVIAGTITANRCLKEMSGI